MTDFALIDLAGPTIIGDPGPLPELFMPQDRKPVLATLADLSFTAPDFNSAYVNRGYWPVDVVRPAPAVWQRNATTPTYTVDGTTKCVTATYALEARPLAEVKADRLAALANYRYTKETGGITINNTLIATDRQSAAMIVGAFNLAQVDPQRVIDWKGKSGWVQLDAAAIGAIAVTVATYIQNCFTVERKHAEAIEACTTAEAAGAYDFTIGWPS